AVDSWPSPMPLHSSRSSESSPTAPTRTTIIRSGMGLEAAYHDPIEEAICCEYGHRFATLFGRLQVIRLPGPVAFLDRNAADRRLMDASVLDRRRIVLTLAVEAIEDHRCCQSEVGGDPR